MAPSHDLDGPTPAKNIPLGQRLCFNVGGQAFETTLATLRNQRDHLLLRLADPEGVYKKQPPGDPIFIDRNPKLFPYILDYLRKGKINLKPKVYWLEDLLDEATYYGLPNLSSKVASRLDEVASAVEHAELPDGSFHRNLLVRASSLALSSPRALSSSAEYSGGTNGGVSPWKQPGAPPAQPPPTAGASLAAASGTLTPLRLAAGCFPELIATPKSTTRGGGGGGGSVSAAVFPLSNHRLSSFPVTPSHCHPSVALSGFPVGTCCGREAEQEVARARQDLMNDNPSPSNLPLPPDYDLGPQVLGTGNEIF